VLAELIIILEIQCFGFWQWMMQSIIAGISQLTECFARAMTNSITKKRPKMN